MEKQPDHIEKKKFPTSSLIFLFESKKGKRWYAAQFLKRVANGLLALVVFSVAVHVSLDIYGLFRPTTGRALKIYHDERLAKYLLAHRYVPQNYKGLLIGTSLSDNLDISAYNKTEGAIPFYNGSMMGANISEVKQVAEKAIDKGIQNVIFCVSPYQFKNSGAKEIELNRKLWFGALGSWNLYETYAVALIRQLGVMPSKYPKQHINEDGVNNFTERYRAVDVEERINLVADVHRGKDFVIDSIAVAEFKSLMQLFKSRNVRFMIYFHPVPRKLYEAQADAYKKFEGLVYGIVDNDHVVDLNAADWNDFTTDYTNYIDNGHLSEKGQSKVTFSIMKSFNYIYPR